MNLVLITSIINTPNTSLSYTDTRSVYTPEERFAQTKKTIESIRKKIPNSKILMVECSDLDIEKYTYLNSKCDYFINLINDKVDACHSISKSLGEGTMTIAAFEFIKNIEYEQLFKLSGRYWLSDDFNYDNYNNDFIVVKSNDISDIDNINTCFYKLPKNITHTFYDHLLSSIPLMHDCTGYEYIFGSFVNNMNNIKLVDNLGVEGFISVSLNSFVKI